MMANGRRLVLLLVVLVGAAAVAADEGWVIERLQVRIDIQPDGTLSVVDVLDVDFRGLATHGIYRDLRNRFIYDGERNREYDITLSGVTSADGRRQQVKRSSEGDTVRFRIGDPDRTISGKETYRIAYRVGHALNAFPDHDELYWNATGTWPVAIAAATIVVRGPDDSIRRVTCFQGAAGSTEPCAARLTPVEATFSATRPLVEEEQITVVVSLRKGAVTEPVPQLVMRPRDITRFFDETPAILALVATGWAGMLGGLITLWWRVGRDRRFVSSPYLSAAPMEERVPLLRPDPTGVEFEPPDKIRPGQMGLIVDEHADTLDVTATIVDLAVRGYLKITELPRSGWFGRADWQLERLKAPDADLLEYERIVLNGIFDASSTRKLSDLKYKFYGDLASAKKSLYRDAVERKWFPRNPNSVRTIYRVLGLLVAVSGLAATIALGRQWGAGLVGLPLVAGGILLAVLARLMPRRTAAGREMMRRTLGFAKYLKTAETAQQAFAERANIFTSYLPYAIAFKCVDRWARAFKDIDMQTATAGWYAGTARFDAGSFSSSLGSFSTSVSSTMTSTPGSSGSSGFSGGSSGGGGGGGGGGRW
jgi:uncharacterized membrane protein YgcG